MQQLIELRSTDWVRWPHLIFIAIHPHDVT